ncbi:B3 domain-containing protein Os04g0676600-like [Phoenix dactylifera]|uniref:B3 domain-containing protein Os04g0676600-like n=1 Tax=Phoenix dactylifera TaxID=42345 RepID=A0A8B8ZGW5_PHODC|nr:B3 domain-containing protein Os04g0676600-like [Phoenix dactylifera]
MSTNALRANLMNYLLSYHGSLYDDLPHPFSASNLKVHNDAIKDPSNTSQMQMKSSSPNTPNKLYPESACQCNPMAGPNVLSASTRGSLMNFVDDGHLDVKETMNHGLEELKMVLQKELTNSDVGRIGRIVLPKKEAESNLPPLSERDGMMLQMDDLILPTTWKFKYRFWPNNRSRMYIMETTGDFVRTHGLEAGDFFIIYKSSASGNYAVASKKGNRLPTSVDLLHCHTMNQCNMNEDGNSCLSRIGKVRGAKHQLCLEPSKSLGQGSHSFLTVARNDSLRTGVLNDFDGHPAGPHFQNLPP